MEGVTFNRCLKKSDRPIFQCLIVEDGLEPEWLEVKSAESHGERSMPNFGASPSIVRESSLSQVLESGGCCTSTLYPQKRAREYLDELR